MQGDSLTKAELVDFRAHISEELKIGVPGSPVYQFDAEDLITTGAASCSVPQDAKCPARNLEVYNTMLRMLSLLLSAHWQHRFLMQLQLRVQQVRG